MKYKLVSGKEDRAAGIVWLKFLKAISLPGITGRFDHFALDIRGNRLFGACGEGFIDIFSQKDIGRYKRVERIVTAAGALPFNPLAGIHGRKSVEG